MCTKRFFWINQPNCVFIFLLTFRVFFSCVYARNNMCESNYAFYFGFFPFFFFYSYYYFYFFVIRIGAGSSDDAEQTLLGRGCPQCVVQDPQGRCRESQAVEHQGDQCQCSPQVRGHRLDFAGWRMTTFFLVYK